MHVEHILSPNDFRRATVDDLKHGRMTYDVIEEIVRCVAVTHSTDPFVDVHVRNIRKLLNDHKRRPGRQRDPDREKRIIAASIYARFNNKGDKHKAAKEAADRYELEPNVVSRYAFEMKDKRINQLIAAAIHKSSRNHLGVPLNHSGIEIDDFNDQ